MPATGAGRLKILLHVGMHKTGTTAIQRSLAAADLHVADGRCRYMRLDAPNFSGAYIALFRNDAVDHTSNWLHGRTAAEVAARRADLAGRYDAQLAAASADTATAALLISGEALSLPVDDGALARLRASLQPWARDMRVQAYIRAPVSFMESHFLQRIKAARQVALDLPDLWPRYRARFDRLDQVFGPAATALAAYAPDRFPQGDVVQDITRRLGISAPGLDRAAPLRANRGLSLEAAALLFCLRRSAPLRPAGPEAIQWIRALADAMAGLGSQRLRFAPALVDPVLDQQAADLRWMESRLGQPITDAGTPDGLRGVADLRDIAAAARGLLDHLDVSALPGVSSLPAGSGLSITPLQLHRMLDEGLAA